MRNLGKEVTFSFRTKYSDGIIWEQTFKGRDVEALGHWGQTVLTASDGNNLWASKSSVQLLPMPPAKGSDKEHRRECKTPGISKEHYLSDILRPKF